MIGPDFGKGASIVSSAVNGFRAELGKAVREQRVRAGLSEDFLSEVLKLAGIPMEKGDVERLEQGEGREPDVKLLTALSFVLELSLDRVLAACLKQASADAGSG